jgi:hypothetical protein
MWRYENFTVLIILSLAPFMWWSAIFLQFSWLWEVVYHWGAINTAVHLYVLPLSILSHSCSYFDLRLLASLRLFQVLSFFSFMIMQREC